MKKRIFRNLINLLPKKIKHPILRQHLKLPIEDNSEFEFKLITTEHEFTQSVQILHDCYVQAKFMHPDTNGMRITPYHLVPDTITAVAKKNGKVIATMSMVRDNSLGLPMEKIFNLSPLRKNNKVLCEVSALAIHKDFRGQNGELLHSLIRFLWRYAFEWYKVDYYVIAVNPTMVDLYEAFYLFKKLPLEKQIDKYKFVNDAPAVGLYRSVMDSFDAFEKYYKGQPAYKDLYHFMKTQKLNPILAKKKYFNISESIINQEFIKKLHKQINLCDGRFTINELNLISNTNGFKDFQELLGNQRVNQRYTTFCPILNLLSSTSDSDLDLDLDSDSDLDLDLNLNLKSNIDLISKFTPDLLPVVKNLSQNGLKIQLPNAQKIFPHLVHILTIKIGRDKKTKIIAKKVWQDQSGQVGLQIIKSDAEWSLFVNYLSQLGPQPIVDLKAS